MIIEVQKMILKNYMKDFKLNKIDTLKENMNTSMLLKRFKTKLQKYL